MPDIHYETELEKALADMTVEEIKAFQEKVKLLNDPDMDRVVQEYVDAVIAKSN